MQTRIRKGVELGMGKEDGGRTKGTREVRAKLGVTVGTGVKLETEIGVKLKNGCRGKVRNRNGSEEIKSMSKVGNRNKAKNRIKSKV